MRFEAVANWHPRSTGGVSHDHDASARPLKALAGIRRHSVRTNDPNQDLLFLDGNQFALVLVYQSFHLWMLTGTALPHAPSDCLAFLSLLSDGHGSPQHDSVCNSLDRYTAWQFPTPGAGSGNFEESSPPTQAERDEPGCRPPARPSPATHDPLGNNARRAATPIA